MPWNVTMSRKAQKGYRALPAHVQSIVVLLMAEIEGQGPIRGNWPNYSKLTGNKHHCHLKKGNPCYVAVWEVLDKQIKLIEVQYVGTHERAPY